MKRIIALICCLLAVSLSVLSCPLCLGAGTPLQASEIASKADSIISFRMKLAGASSVQSLIDGELTQQAGTLSEWYILALLQYEKDYDFSSYRKALEEYVSANEESSAVKRELFALLLLGTGSSASYITDALNNSIGQLGIMSWIYGLHLMNNGVSCKSYTKSQVISTVLSLRRGDGGWSVSGTSADVDVTAMAVQALAPYYGTDSAVKTAVDSALALLSDRQLTSGAFKSYGTENPESGAQVLTALSALNINALTDSRFIKNGKTVLDGIQQFRLSDGSYSHTLSGEYSFTATVQTLYSLIALYRQTEGLSPLYQFAAAKPAQQTSSAASASRPATTKATTASSASGGASSQGGSPSLIGGFLGLLSGLTGTSSESSTQSKPENTTAAPTTAAQSQTTAKATEASASSQRETNSGTTEAATSTQASTAAAPTTAESALTQTVTASSEEATVTCEAIASTSSATVCAALTQSVSEEALDNSGSFDFSIRGLLCAMVIAAAVSLCLSLYSRGKRSKGNFILIGTAAALILAAIITTEIQSRDSYYSAEDTSPENPVVVTMSIRCDTIAGIASEEHVPADGIILDTTQFTVSEGSTVFDVLTKAAREYGIQTENDSQTSSSYSSAYISGINYIYQFDYGEMSGWMYTVNGVFSPVGCGEYTVEDGDEICWLYTTNMGEDLK